MGRAAGSGSNYEFVLFNKSTNKYDKDHTIELISVTSVIGATLIKQGLTWWAYYQTVESVAALVTALKDHVWEEDEDIDLMGVLTDPGSLDELIAANRMRPDDVKEDAGDRGHAEHATLEALANAALAGDAGDGDIMAEKIRDSDRSTGWAKATADWWLTKRPEVVSSETFVKSLKHGFCGTFDLLYRDADGALVLTDLKSRGAGKGIYESDHIQTGGYEIAYEEETGTFVDYRTVLVVREDGSWIEQVADIERDAFLDLLSLYNKMKGKGV